MREKGTEAIAEETMAKCSEMDQSHQAINSRKHYEPPKVVRV